MEPLTLITTAITLLSPYLIKSGEKFSEKIGESIWDWLKKKFTKKEDDEISKSQEKDFNKELTKILLNKINSEPDFKEEFEIHIKKAQNELESYSQQNISNYDKVGKQINIQKIEGNITM